MSIIKINDLSNSPLRTKYSAQNFIPESQYAVLMLRVSSKKQDTEAHHSKQAQGEITSDYIPRNNLVLAHEVWDIAEQASKHELRKNFLQMIAFVRQSQNTNRAVKHIIFSHQSRSNRNRESARELESLVRKDGVTLHCVRDGMKLTALSPLEDWIKWDLFNSLNEKFIDDHRRNVWDGTVKRIEMGLAPGKAPYGYRNYRPTESSLSIFIFVEEAAAYMKDAFELFSTGTYSEVQLCHELNQRHPTAQKKPTAKRISELLRNPFYYGDFLVQGKIYRGNPEYHPPLIGFELWKRVQDVLTGRLRKKVSYKQHHYLGLMRCGGRLLDEAGNETDVACGYSVTAEEKRKPLADGSIKFHYYYHCSRNKPDGLCSQRDKGYLQTARRHSVNYTEAEIELLFEAVFRPLSFTPDVCKWMQEVLMQEHLEKSGDHYQQLSAFQSRHKMLEQYISKAYEDKLQGTITEELWRVQHSKWTLEREQVQRQIESICADKDDYIENGVLLIELAQRTEYIYKTATAEVKRKLVEIVSSNHVLRDGTISFDYRKPFDVLAKCDPKEKWWR